MTMRWCGDDNEVARDDNEMARDDNEMARDDKKDSTQSFVVIPDLFRDLTS